MSDCRFGVSPVNYPDPDPDQGSLEEITPYATSLRRRFFVYHHEVKHPHPNINLS